MIKIITRKILFSIYLLCFFVKVASAQSTIKAVKVDTPPLIDGKVNDEVWNQAFKINQFYQREPNTGAPITERTEFFTCYDSKYIYFAVKCWDNPENISAKEMVRDAQLRYDDRIKIILDTYLNHRSGYYFSINPLGSKYDAIIGKNGAVFNRDWNGIWDGKARITNYGWEAEIAIPFITLGFNEKNTKWGIKYVREIENKIESGYWPSANLNGHPNQVSDAGVIEGIVDISQGIGLDISPYIITNIDKKDGVNSNPKLSGGLDISYQLTSGLKTSLSINTDFAETEVDNRQINLTRFSLHYPEKRNFFLDGANYFQFGNEGERESPVAKKVVAFFSRQMGLDTLGKPIPINYAAKFTGIINDWNIGMMYINDDREDGINNFYVTRINRNFWQQSSIGFIGTYGNAFGDEANLLTGVDLKLSTSTFKEDNNMTLILYGLKSITENVSNDNNGAYGVQFIYPNDFINGRLGYYQIGKNFMAGMGFVPRTGVHEYFGNVILGPRLNKYGILQIESGGGFSYISNLETGFLETREYEIQPIGIRLLSGDEISYSITNQYELLKEDFNIFEDKIITSGKYSWWQNEIKMKTKGARNIWGEFTFGFGQFYNGKRKNIELEIHWKIGVPFLIGGTLNRNIIDLPAGSFTANVYQFNANILFSPNMSLYNYFQYDNATKNAGLQSRFQWILKPGNEVILAWNSNFLKSRKNYTMDVSSLRLKLKYNIRF